MAQLGIEAIITASAYKLQHAKYRDKTTDANHHQLLLRQQVFYNDLFIRTHRESHMKSRAAVAFEAGKPLEIVEVDLEGPKAGEVLIEIKATGVCHTDAFTLSGDDPEGAFPAIL